MLNNNLIPGQKARIFNMHLPFQAINNEVYGGECTINSVYYHEGKHIEFGTTDGAYGISPNNILMLLTPLSAISDEHAEEVAKMLPISMPNSKGEFLHLNGLEYCNRNGINVTNWVKKQLSVLVKDNYQVREYLMQKGYAVPLFIAPGHPDNSKTAIELGLAIDRTTI